MDWDGGVVIVVMVGIVVLVLVALRLGPVAIGSVLHPAGVRVCKEARMGCASLDLAALMVLVEKVCVRSTAMAMARANEIDSHYIPGSVRECRLLHCWEGRKDS